MMKTRAILSLIIAILTGFVIGYITSSQIRHIKTRDVRSMSSEHRFKERTFQIIEPTEGQIIILDSIVDSYAIRFDSLNKTTKEQFKKFLNDFHSDIFPYLTDDQKTRMEEFAKHIRKKPPKKK